MPRDRVVESRLGGITSRCRSYFARAWDVKPITELRIDATQHDARGWLPENYSLFPAVKEGFPLA
jgi:hypothetical protein